MFIYRFYIGHGPRAMVCSKRSNNIKKRYEPIDGICGDDEIDIHSTFQSRAIIEFHIITLNTFISITKNYFHIIRKQKNKTKNINDSET